MGTGNSCRACGGTTTRIAPAASSTKSRDSPGGICVRPTERLGPAIVVRDVATNLARAIGHRREDAARQDVPFDLRKPRFDLIEPRRMGRREVHTHPRVEVQKGLHLLRTADDLPLEIRAPSLTPDDENRLAPALLGALGGILDQLPIACTLQIGATAGRSFARHHVPEERLSGSRLADHAEGVVSLPNSGSNGRQ
jgi:hypothetical protein